MQSQDVLLLIFTGVLAAAVLMQSLVFFGIYRSIRRMVTWMEGQSKDIIRNIDVISAKADAALTTIKSVGEDLKPVTERLNTTTEIVYKRVAALDVFLSDTTRTAQLEILRIQDRIESASQKVADTLEILHRSILAPVNEINAITRGISVGINMLFRRKKEFSSTSHQDEEMFI